MFNFKTFYNLVGFKLTWLSCVIGELYYNSWIGFFVGLLYLLFFFYFENNKFRAFYLIISFSLFGYFFDSMLSFFSIYKIKADINVLFLPIWFLVLWPSFSSLLVNTLSFLEKKIFLSIILGVLIGPMSYYFGVSITLAKVNNFYLFFLFTSLFWGSMMFYYANYILKDKKIIDQ